MSDIAQRKEFIIDGNLFSQQVVFMMRLKRF